MQSKYISSIRNGVDMLILGNKIPGDLWKEIRNSLKAELESNASRFQVQGEMENESLGLLRTIL